MTTQTAGSNAAADVLENLPAAPSGPLTPQEAADLARYEAMIEAGFIMVGEALKEIRVRHLWRDAAASFDAYCRQKFSFGERRANQKIEAAAVLVDLLARSPDLGPFITTVSAAEALSEVTPAERPAVIMEAVAKANDEGKAKPKAKHIKKAASALPTAKVKAKPKKTAFKISLTFDEAAEAKEFRSVFAAAGLKTVSDNVEALCLQSIGVTPFDTGIFLVALGEKIKADGQRRAMVLSVE